MKRHLAMAAAIAGVCSHAAFADPEADFWQQPEPKSLTRSPQVLVVAPAVNLSSLKRDNPSVYGTPAEPDSADRIVRLGPDSKSVKVAYGETVKFIVETNGGPERSFAWRFDMSPAMSQVDLKDVAPADLLDHDVRVLIVVDSRHGGS